MNSPSKPSSGLCWRIIRAVLALALVSGLGTWLAPGLGLASSHGRRTTPPQGEPRPPLAWTPTRHDRLLVLAPHPDDESAACGGLTVQALQAGAGVHVVYVTNGDGFRVAAERVFERTDISPSDYLKLGAMRQRESLGALARLGLSKKDVTFLGYPDKGLNQMWLHYWGSERAYTSRYTKEDHNSYRDSLRPGGPYCGRALLDDLEAVMRRFRPTVVAAPHPSDAHGDHWALYCYTVAGLYELGLLDRVELRLYLVHRADKWLSPKGGFLDPTAPPQQSDELGTRWSLLPLSSETAQRKREAIMQHHTQLLVMRDFLLNFARNRERFGQIPFGPLADVAPGAIRVDGKGDDWAQLPLALPGRGSQPGKRVPAAAQITQVQVARDPRKLFVLLDLGGSASADLSYQVHLHLLSRGQVGPPTTYVLHPGRQCPGVEFHIQGSRLELSLPWPRQSLSDAIMLSADSWRGSSGLDTTPWVVLRAQPVVSAH